MKEFKSKGISLEGIVGENPVKPQIRNYAPI